MRLWVVYKEQVKQTRNKQKNYNLERESVIKMKLNKRKLINKLYELAEETENRKIFEYSGAEETESERGGYLLGITRLKARISDFITKEFDLEYYFDEESK